MGMMRRGVQYPLADCLVIALTCTMVGWLAHGQRSPGQRDEPVYSDVPPPRGSGPMWEWGRCAGDQDLCEALGVHIMRFGALLPEATNRVHLGLYVDKLDWDAEKRLDTVAVIDETIDMAYLSDDKGHRWVPNPANVRLILAPVEGHRLSTAEHAEFQLSLDGASFVRTIDNPFRRHSGWGGPNPSLGLPQGGDLDIWEASHLFADYEHGEEQWQRFRQRVRLSIKDVGWMADYNPPERERLER